MAFFFDAIFTAKQKVGIGLSRADFCFSYLKPNIARFD